MMDSELQKILDGLPESERAVVTAHFEQIKRKNQPAKNREEFTFATKSGAEVTLAIGNKDGNLRVYGIREQTGKGGSALPISLSEAQWKVVIEAMPEIKAYLTKHKGNFTPRESKRSKS